MCDAAYAEAVFEGRSITDIRIALDRVAKHPLRGAVTSHDATTGHGKVTDLVGGIEPGVKIWSQPDGHHFRLTEVVGGLYSWDELVMSPESFPGFVKAMADLLK